MALSARAIAARQGHRESGGEEPSMTWFHACYSVTSRANRGKQR